MNSKQQLFNLICSVCGFLCAWGFVAIWNKNEALTKELAEVRVLVAGDYVRKDELRSYINDLSIKLQRIEDKLDQKADRKWSQQNISNSKNLSIPASTSNTGKSVGSFCKSQHCLAWINSEKPSDH